MSFNYTIIAAVDSKGGIAKQQKLPWHYPEDLKWFKQKTQDQICVMGRNTFERDIVPLMTQQDALGKKYWNTRYPFVVSNTVNVTDYRDYRWGHLLSIKEVEDFFSPCEIMIIGGAQIYNQAIKFADKIYLTQINHDYDCDLFFPMQEVLDNFTLNASKPGIDKDLTFNTYIRTNKLGD